MSPNENKRAYRQDLMRAALLIAAGLLVSGFSLARIADHDHEIVRSEEHRTDLTSEVALASDRRPVHLHAVRALTGDLDLDEDLAVRGLHLAARVRGTVGASTHDRLGGRGSRRLQEEQERDALEQVRLPLAVRADSDDEPFRKRLEPRLSVVAEVPELDPAELHPGRLSRRAWADERASRDT